MFIEAENTGSVNIAVMKHKHEINLRGNTPGVNEINTDASISINNS